ncbi:MAG: ABC transporter ATP-binding protein [Methanocorpusculum sp.]|uniref:ABC transporter ATP-binding protein n=1 Tax=Methanocorpusculum sp. TaxID=2058474 RepID=UPI002B204C12|nr:ABC transporter ATP-binding protein [Methanocorpusculum sp.]MEA5086381.1 ABC transporter ATP-binding protein [Methanocorpusculum sp.]
MSEDIITVRGLAKSYGKKEVVHPLDLSVKKGEILAIIGPSGAGKSTLMRMMDTIEPPSKGELIIFGESVTKRSVHGLRGRMGMLFQKTVLFDRTVAENVELGLSYRNLSKKERVERVSAILEQMGLSRFAERGARTLSGGEGQRISFARVLVTRPEILFLDEPTANLDPVSTRILEEMIIRENRENKTTIIINTHDQAQGQRLADRIAVMMDGTFVQIGSADEVFYHPISGKVAKFVGIQNIFTGHVRYGEVVSSQVSFCQVPVSLAGNVQIMLRAEDIALSKTGITGDRRSVSGVVISSARSGAFLEVSVNAGCLFTVIVPFRQTGDVYAPGERVWIGWRSDVVHVIPDTS